MKWESNAELRLRVLLELDLCQRRLANQYMNAGQSAIAFGDDMKQMPILMGIGGDQRHQYFTVEENFRRFYYLTNDRFGEVVLQLLCEPDKKAILDNILAEGLSGPQQYGLVENDAMDGEEPVLFGYTCDMPRIKRFNAGLNAHRTKGTLYCFDFQKDALNQICGSNVDIRCIDFEAVKQLL